jgi:hypothetical protein
LLFCEEAKACAGFWAISLSADRFIHLLPKK